MRFKNREQQAAVMMQYAGSYTRKNRRFAVRKSHSTVRTGKVKTSKVNKKQNKLALVRYHRSDTYNPDEHVGEGQGWHDDFEGHSLAAQRGKDKKAGAYDPRKDPESQLNRTGNPTKEEKRWISWLDGGKVGKSPYEIMHPPPYEPKTTIPSKPVVQNNIDSLSDVEKKRFEKLKKHRDKLIQWEGPADLAVNKEAFNKQYSDESLMKASKHEEEMVIGIDVYNIKDSKMLERMRKKIPPDQLPMFNKSPQDFLDGRIRYQGTWVPKGARSREEQRHAERRKELEHQLPDTISWWLPVRMKDDGDFESAFSIEKRHDGSFNLKDLHNSQGGAWHSGKYLSDKHVIKKYKKIDGTLPNSEIKKMLREEIVGIVEVTNTRKARQHIEQSYQHLKPGEKENVPIGIAINKNMITLGTNISSTEETRLQPVSVRIGHLKPSDIKRQVEYISNNKK